MLELLRDCDTGTPVCARTRAGVLRVARSSSPFACFLLVQVRRVGACLLAGLARSSRRRSRRSRSSSRQQPGRRRRRRSGCQWPDALALALDRLRIRARGRRGARCARLCLCLQQRHSLLESQPLQSAHREGTSTSSSTSMMVE